MQDFVRLAGWEDRGYYAMRASTEKAQRHLHRLTRNATEVTAGAGNQFDSWTACARSQLAMPLQASS
jgi:hypothetical protein